MGKATDLILKISKDTTKNWREELWQYDLLRIFEPVLSNNEKTLSDKNKTICYIVYAYDPDSGWIDLKKDRIDNKTRVLMNLDANIKDQYYADIIANKQDETNTAIFNFLEELKDWRWRSVFDLLDFASKMSRFAATETDEEKSFTKKKGEQEETRTVDVGIEIITKVNREKGNLIQQSLEARKTANELIEQIRKEYVVTDNATQQDFGFAFSETTKKKDPLKWRSFIKDLEEIKKLE